MKPYILLSTCRRKKEKTESEYRKDFEQADLYENWWFDKNSTILKHIEDMRTEIKTIIETLAHQDTLRLKELEKVDKIRLSPFVNDNLMPIDFGIKNDDMRNSQPNNQADMGESLHELYELVK